MNMITSLETKEILINMLVRMCGYIYKVYFISHDSLKTTYDEII